MFNKYYITDSQRLTMDLRAHKRMRHNTSIVQITKSISNVAIAQQVTALEVDHNHEIIKIMDYPYLTVIRLTDTKVNCIDKCPSLYSLNVVDNSGLKLLYSSSIRDIRLEDVYNLRVVDIPSAINVVITRLHVLRELNAKHAKNVTIRDISLYHSNINIQTSFPKLDKLEVIDIEDFNITAIQDSSIKELIIRNSEIIHLADLEGYRNITIENCESLQFVSRLFDIGKLTIINCPNLCKIDTVITCNKLHIKRCNNLRTISNVEGDTVVIEYCFKLSVLPSMYVDNLMVNRCPALANVTLYGEMQSFDVIECCLLQDVYFHADDMHSYSSLNITMSGNNRIKEIKDWFVASLAISDNHTLEAIVNVNDIAVLLLENCSELCVLANVFIQEELSIEMCHALEEITDVFGGRKLSIIDCDDLMTMESSFTEYESITIKHCPQLFATFDGSTLQELTLFDCGSIVLFHLSQHALVSVRDVRLLPNISVELLDVQTPDVDELPVYKEAIFLNKHIIQLIAAARVITKKLKSYLARKTLRRFIQLKKEDRLPECAICHDELEPSLSTFIECNHVFHTECIHHWFNIRRSCPLCNIDL